MIIDTTISKKLSTLTDPSNYSHFLRPDILKQKNITYQLAVNDFSEEIDVGCISFRAVNDAEPLVVSLGFTPDADGALCKAGQKEHKDIKSFFTLASLKGKPNDALYLRVVEPLPADSKAHYALSFCIDLPNK